MNAEWLSELARKIADGQFLISWKMYLLLIALSVIGTVANIWIGAYAKKRAQTHASKVDLAEILRQLEETTKTVKGVELSLSHKDWSLKENKILRRTKLEELMIAVYDAKNWLSKKSISAVFEESLEIGVSSMKKVEMLSLLYFPELRNATLVLSNAHAQLDISSHQAFGQIQKARGEANLLEFTILHDKQLNGTTDLPEVAVAKMSAMLDALREKLAQTAKLRDSLMETNLPLHQSLLKAIHALETEAETLMRNITAVEAS